MACSSLLLETDNTCQRIKGSEREREYQRLRIKGVSKAEREREKKERRKVCNTERINVGGIRQKVGKGGKETK